MPQPAFTLPASLYLAGPMARRRPLQPLAQMGQQLAQLKLQKERQKIMKEELRLGEQAQKLNEQKREDALVGQAFQYGRTPQGQPLTMGQARTVPSGGMPGMTYRGIDPAKQKELALRKQYYDILGKRFEQAQMATQERERTRKSPLRTKAQRQVFMDLANAIAKDKEGNPVLTKKRAIEYIGKKGFSASDPLFKALIDRYPDKNLKLAPLSARFGFGAGKPGFMGGALERVTGVGKQEQLQMALRAHLQQGMNDIMKQLIPPKRGRTTRSKSQNDPLGIF